MSSGSDKREEGPWPTSTTRLAGVIGSEARRSLSPVIHNAAFAALGLDWVYLAFQVGEEDTARAIDSLRCLGVEGLSVTMPHKVRVIDAIDALGPDAESTGAVNTVRREGNLLVGENTDVRGFVLGVERALGVGLAGRAVLVVGAGGAARAVVRACQIERAARVGVVSRRPEAAAALVDHFAPVSGVTDLTQISSPELTEVAESFELIVNATPAGSDSTSMPLPSEVLEKILTPTTFVFDLVYLPAETPLVRAARAAGGKGEGGLEMLLAQAALQFELWTGESAPAATMKEAAEAAVARIGVPN